MLSQIEAAGVGVNLRPQEFSSALGPVRYFAH